MLSSFLDLQSLAMFLILSLLFMISAFRFNFQTMKNNPRKIAIIFLASGVIAGFSDLIVSLQDKESSLMVGDSITVAKQTGLILLSPFYGLLFASVTWFSSTEGNK